VHPALALVPIVPFFPHGLRDRGLMVEPAPEAHDTLTLFERWWRLPVEVVLMFFGLVNAGVPFHGLEEGAWVKEIKTMMGASTRHNQSRTTHELRQIGKPRTNLRRLPYSGLCTGIARIA
jgi:hypothetical protein